MIAPFGHLIMGPARMWFSTISRLRCATFRVWPSSAMVTTPGMRLVNQQRPLLVHDRDADDLRGDCAPPSQISEMNSENSSDWDEIPSLA